jgi:hypothetical protein
LTKKRCNAFLFGVNLLNVKGLFLVNGVSKWSEILIHNFILSSSYTKILEKKLSVPDKHTDSGVPLNSRAKNGIYFSIYVRKLINRRQTLDIWVIGDTDISFTLNDLSWSCGFVNLRIQAKLTGLKLRDLCFLLKSVSSNT